jgi:PIN domain nuclease of toxin-antitoxin system
MYLLDTHVWLWMLVSPERLGPTALGLLTDTSSRPLLSAVTSWEIAIKYALGRLELPMPPAAYVPDRMRRTGVEGLLISHAHTLRVASLEAHHRDPFDRLLVAQALEENVPILTADPVFAQYDVEVLSAA